MLVRTNYEYSINDMDGDKWAKVCFPGPYNEMSEKVLCFNWQVSEYADVLKSDDHNVIVFATESEVIEYVVHSRSKDDLWQIPGE